MIGTLPRPLRTADDPVTIVRRLHARFHEAGVDLPVRLWDGSVLGPQDTTFRIVLRHPWTIRGILPASDLSAGEAYMAGDLDVEGSLIDALTVAGKLEVEGRFELAHRVEALRDLWSLPQPPTRHEEARRVRLRGRPHSTERDQAAVRHHYDVGNDFYRRILDDELVYSCAIFDDADAAAPAGDRRALTRAQVRKLDTVCSKLRLRPGERFLDVGCGWGALVLHAARHYGVEAVGITLSPAQAELARARVEHEGLADRVEIRVADYREVSQPVDAIASVGMVEHVGHTNLGRYARTLRRLLRPGGRLLNHGITTGRRTQVRDLSTVSDSFLGTYVFPDGALIPIHEMVRTLHEAGFEIRDVEELRPHYARTLRHWVANLEANWEAVLDEVGETTARVWRAYMAGSVVGFENGDLGVAQILAVEPDARLPLGREWMRPVRPAPESGTADT